MCEAAAAASAHVLPAPIRIGAASIAVDVAGQSADRVHASGQSFGEQLPDGTGETSCRKCCTKSRDAICERICNACMSDCFLSYGGACCCWGESVDGFDSRSKCTLFIVFLPAICLYPCVAPFMSESRAYMCGARECLDF